MRNRFLGIDYDTWHLILAIVATALGFIGGWYFLLFYSTLEVNSRFFAALLLGMMISHHLQAYNESRQLLDPFVRQKYGTWQAFQANSYTDWRYFYLGWFISPFVCGLLTLVLP